MKSQHNKCDTIIKKEHDNRIENYKYLGCLMDKEREEAWKSRVCVSNEMKTQLKTLEMKNNLKAEDRNNKNHLNMTLRNKEKQDLEKMLSDQRAKHRKEEEDINDLCRQQDFKHMQEKDELEETIRKQHQKHR